MASVLLLCGVGTAEPVSRTTSSKSNWPSIAVSPRDQVLAVASNDRNSTRSRINVVDLTSGRGLSTIEVPEQSIRTMAFNPTGDQLIAGSEDGKITIWRFRSNSEKNAWTAHRGNVQSITTHWSAIPNSLPLILSTSDDGTAALWDQAGARIVRELDHLPSNPTNGLFLANGRYALGFDDGLIRVFRQSGSESFQTLQGHRSAITSMATSSSKALFATGSADGTVRVWKSDTGTMLHLLNSHRDSVTSIAVTPKGDKLVSVSKDQQMLLWSIPSGVLIGTLPTPSAPVMEMGITRDGALLVTSSTDQVIRLINLVSRLEADRFMVDGDASKSAVWDWNLSSSVQTIR